jgi:hypothetical protein
MWRQLLFWTIVGPKHLRRFLLLWLALMGFFFYAFIHEGFDGSVQRALPPHRPLPSASNR